MKAGGVGSASEIIGKLSYYTEKKPNRVRDGQEWRSDLGLLNAHKLVDGPDKPQPGGS